jgi:hypothetical protein
MKTRVVKKPGPSFTTIGIFFIALIKSNVLARVLELVLSLLIIQQVSSYELEKKNGYQ